MSQEGRFRLIWSPSIKASKRFNFDCDNEREARFGAFILLTNDSFLLMSGTKRTRGRAIIRNGIETIFDSEENEIG